MVSRKADTRRVDEPLVWRVFYRRGTVPILLLLDRCDSARFTQINETLEPIARQVLASRLAELRELAIVARNPGDGGPATDEYELTSLGKHLANAASVLNAVAQDNRLPELA